MDASPGAVGDVGREGHGIPIMGVPEGYVSPGTGGTENRGRGVLRTLGMFRGLGDMSAQDPATHISVQVRVPAARSRSWGRGRLPVSHGAASRSSLVLIKRRGTERRPYLSHGLCSPYVPERCADSIGGRQPRLEGPREEDAGGAPWTPCLDSLALLGSGRLLHRCHGLAVAQHHRPAGASRAPSPRRERDCIVRGVEWASRADTALLAGERLLRGEPAPRRGCA